MFWKLFHVVLVSNGHDLHNRLNIHIQGARVEETQEGLHAMRWEVFNDLRSANPTHPPGVALRVAQITEMLYYDIYLKEKGKAHVQHDCNIVIVLLVKDATQTAVTQNP